MKMLDSMNVSLWEMLKPTKISISSFKQIFLSSSLPSRDALERVYIFTMSQKFSRNMLYIIKKKEWSQKILFLITEIRNKRIRP